MDLPVLARGKYCIDIMLAEPGRRFIQCLENCLTFQVSKSASQAGVWEFNQSPDQGALLIRAVLTEKD